MRGVTIMKTLRAISPVIATIIIVAVAVAISIALVGWIMGLWGSFTGGTETLQIMPDSKLYATSGTLILHIVNKGTAAAVIYKVEIAGIGSGSIVNATGTGVTISKGTITTVTLSPGADATLTVNFTSSNIVAGASYLVKVYTKAGNMFSASVVAE
ncbi:MAG: hypothetical protein ABWW69_00700 [Pyrodictiaceae archaeon]